jgi:Flp pilus assembly protein TadG
MRPSYRDEARNDTGAAAVEFALVLPLLLLVVVGIIQFGRVYSQQIELEGAANAGARYLAVHPTDAAGARTKTRDAANNITFSDADIAVTATTPCNGTDSVTVVASHVFVFDIPLLPHPDITLHGKGVMPCTG